MLPQRDGEGSQEVYFAVPAQRQVFGVVNDLILFIFTFTLADLLLFLLLPLFSCPGLLALDIFMSELSLFLGGWFIKQEQSQEISAGHQGALPLIPADAVLPRIRIWL